MTDDHTRALPDEYVPPRYPVDDPPTYRQRCSCGWTGPERYAGVDVGDHAHHVWTQPDYAEQDEHDQWHPVWVEGCDGCIDRADHLERTRDLPDLHLVITLEVHDEDEDDGNPDLIEAMREGHRAYVREREAQRP